jgi:nucleolar GTP-binding protein
MASYNFKNITPIPNSDEFVNIVLSKTQRKTPTQVHPNYKIQRIRGFYIRKVKFCTTLTTDKLAKILSDFPKLEDLHPFFGDLINILYDRDHYKIALGQINNLKNVLDNIAKDYIKLLKYGDSAYRCKMLKRAALGRIVTALKKMKNSFTY